MDDRKKNNIFPWSPANANDLVIPVLGSEELAYNEDNEDIQDLEVSLPISANLIKDVISLKGEEVAKQSVAAESHIMDSFTREYDAETGAVAEEKGASTSPDPKGSSDTGISSAAEEANKGTAPPPPPPPLSAAVSKRNPTAIVVEQPPEDEEIEMERRPSSPPTPPLIMPRRVVGIRIGGGRRVAPATPEQSPWSPAATAATAAMAWRRPQSVWERRMEGQESLATMSQLRPPSLTPPGASASSSSAVDRRRLSTVRNVRTARKIRSMRKKVSIRRTQVRKRRGLPLSRAWAWVVDIRMLVRKWRKFL